MSHEMECYENLNRGTAATLAHAAMLLQSFQYQLKHIDGKVKTEHMGRLVITMGDRNSRIG